MAYPDHSPKGLLMATMEPPSNIEEEFQDWYDFEHFPERQDCEGFETAKRLVCIDGFPRYLALYDLTSVDVLQGPAYSKIAITRYSPWTHRIMSKVWGQYRAEGIQIYPGPALIGQKGPSSRVVVWRFKDIERNQEAGLIAGFSKLYDGNSSTVQVRLFRVSSPVPGDYANADYVGIVELQYPVADVDMELLGKSLKNIDSVNVYVSYSRKALGAFPSKK